MHTNLSQQYQTRPCAPRTAALALVASLALPVLLLSACTTYKPTIPPSEGHISAADVAPPGEKERILPPVTSTATFTPPPKPRARPTTYSVVVHEVPVKELLLALARDTKENIDIHPGLSGLVSLNAIDETLPSILERIAKQVNMRYKVDGRTVVVEPDAPHLKTYKVNYVNMTRDTQSTISVSGQVGTGGSTGGESGGTSSTSVKTTSKSDFWEVLRKNVNSILAASRKLDQSAAERQALAERTKAQREQRLAQAEAVARAGASAKDLFKEVFGEEAMAKLDEVDEEIVINPIAGSVTVLATERQHALVQQYLDSVQTSVQRQVLIEATIAEVRLSQSYQAGIDWRQLANNGNGFRIDQQLINPAGALVAPPSLIIGYGGPLADFNISIRMLEQFGNTRVLSSPKLMALNNQTALLKVVDNIVYFTITQQSSQAQTSNVTTVTSQPNTVAVGVVVSLTPQVHENGNVTLTVRPTISRVLRYVEDPNPELTAAPNLVPEIAVREMESVLQLTSGQTAILGGLMQDEVQRDRDQVPYAGSLPRVGDLFAYRNENVAKSELVIFIRPIVVTNPSLDSDALKHLRKLLPEVDRTGENP
jgi:MSHA type pilus biogenesis protein MshL